MNLTPELKEQINAMSYMDMLALWRFAPPGDEMFQGESGEYFGKCMFTKRDANPGAAVAASKAIGWGR